ncbi:MAG TPA: outer membrane beta-barrel protein [Candidatus Saccharimonadales bacterium]|nr:outer membrane beta-barrel protein [Candidatus Saccharimonadales bacterium]
MTLLRRILPALLLLAAAGAPAFAGGNVNVLLGQRFMDENDWGPVDKPVAYGVQTDFSLFGWPVNLAVGLHESRKSDSFTGPPNQSRYDVTGTFTELDLGVVRPFDPGYGIHPYIGGGLAAVHAKKEADHSSGGSREGSDTTEGIYLAGGVYWKLGERFNLGVHARIVAGSGMTLGNQDASPDYYQAGALFGWSWE